MALSIHGKNLVQIIIDTNEGITPEAKKAAVDYLTTLRDAGEKMAERLRALEAFQDEWNMRDTPRNFFTDDDAAALAEWEAANK